VSLAYLGLFTVLIIAPPTHPLNKPKYDMILQDTLNNLKRSY